MMNPKTNASSTVRALLVGALCAMGVLLILGSGDYDMSGGKGCSGSYIPGPGGSPPYYTPPCPPDVTPMEMNGVWQVVETPVSTTCLALPVTYLDGTVVVTLDGSTLRMEWPEPRAYTVCNSSFLRYGREVLLTGGKVIFDALTVTIDPFTGTMSGTGTWRFVPDGVGVLCEGQYVYSATRLP